MCVCASHLQGSAAPLVTALRRVSSVLASCGSTTTVTQLGPHTNDSPSLHTPITVYSHSFHNIAPLFENSQTPVWRVRDGGPSLSAQSTGWKGVSHAKA